MGADVGRACLEALGSVVHGVQGGDVGKERLGGADVGGGLVAPNVLLARLHGHAVGGPPLRVNRDANDAAGHLACTVHAHTEHLPISACARSCSNAWGERVDVEIERT